MNRFTIRIELHNVEYDDHAYELLHAEMEEAGFKTTIQDTTTLVEYHLPRAEYNMIGDLTRGQVLDLAKKAAKASHDNFSILVTPTDGRNWINLKPVKKAG